MLKESVVLHSMLRVYCQNSVRCLPVFQQGRFYSEVASGVAAGKQSQRPRLDKSMIKPFVWIMIFGSLVTNVVERRQRFSDMKKRYGLKTRILQDLIEKVETGDHHLTEEDIEEELKLVNKMFIKNKSLGMKEVDSILSQMQIAVPKFKNAVEEEEESLEDLWKELLEEVNNENPIDRKQKRKEAVLKKPQIDNSEDIVLDKAVLRELEERERDENKKFTQSIDRHLIVENPGELSSSAKFL